MIRRIIETPAFHRNADREWMVSLPMGALIIAGAAALAFPVMAIVVWSIG